MSQRGDQFYGQAEEKLNKFAFFTSKKMKNEDAADLFVKAGNCYKSVKQFSKAGQAYLRAASCYEVSGLYPQSAGALVDAATIYQSSTCTPQEKEETYNLLQRAVGIYKDQGNASQAARILIDLSEVYSKNNMIESQLDTLREAIQLYKEEKQTNVAANHLETVVDILIKLKRYSDAVREIKTILLLKSNENMVRGVAAKYALKLVLLRLADDDIVGANHDYEELINTTSFDERTNEAKFIQALFAALEEHDGSAVSSAFMDYDTGGKEEWVGQLVQIIALRLEGGETGEDFT